MKIAVLLSGGVDSAVALKLLKDQGHLLKAFYLKVWLEDELSFLGNCPWEEDLSYAKAVCDALSVPLEVVSLQRDYWQLVVSYVIDQIRKGNTPNPDMLCNSTIKFGRFLDMFGDQFDFIASGHYAKTEHAGDDTFLMTSADPVKDQTYFLAALNRAQLKKCLFPIGDMTKAQVRDYAHAQKLSNAKRKDSQGICFLGKIKFSDFLKHHFGEKKGDIVQLETGDVLGQHRGYWYFTIGQRKGLGLGSGPWYVVKKDIPSNRVYVSNKIVSQKVNTIKIDQCNWLYSKEVLSKLAPYGKPLQVKIRHGEKKFLASLSKDKDGSPLEGDDFFSQSLQSQLSLQSPSPHLQQSSKSAQSQSSQFQSSLQLPSPHSQQQSPSHPPPAQSLLPKEGWCHLLGGDHGVAMGQFAVFYSGKYCLGSGVIAHACVGKPEKKELAF